MIDTKTISTELLDRVRVGAMRWDQPKILHALQVGENPASKNFLKQKQKTAGELGIGFQVHEVPADTSVPDIKGKIFALSVSPHCNGIIVQLPLPENISREDKHEILNTVPSHQDPDVLGEASIGAFYTGRSKILPPSVATVQEILLHEESEVTGKKVVLIGAGLLIGKPLGLWLQHRVAIHRLREIVILDETVATVKEETISADIVISGTGCSHLFSADDLKEGALVIDFGFSRMNDCVTGDFNPAGAESKNIRYTRTPGGTGPILVAKLFENFVTLNSN